MDELRETEGLRDKEPDSLPVLGLVGANGDPSPVWSFREARVMDALRDKATDSLPVLGLVGANGDLSPVLRGFRETRVTDALRDKATDSLPVLGLVGANGDPSLVFRGFREARVMDELRDKAPESLLGLDAVNSDGPRRSGVAALSTDRRGRGDRDTWLSGVRLRGVVAVTGSAPRPRIVTGCCWFRWQLDDGE